MLGLPLGVLYAIGAAAGMVTVTARSTSAIAPQEVVIVFDSLDATPPPSRDSAVIDQIDKRFVPQITVVRSGTAVAFPNSDAIRHQVYSFSPAHPFNLKLYAGSPRVDVVFDKPGLVVLGCNIHDTMLAFVVIVDSPYFAKLPSSGTLEMSLPAGRYRLRVWHPFLKEGIAPSQITVGSGPVIVPLTVDLDSSHAATAAWPE